MVEARKVYQLRYTLIKSGLLAQLYCPELVINYDIQYIALIFLL